MQPEGAATLPSYPTLSIVVPIYNEIELIDVQVRRIVTFLPEHVPDHEIILVESGSTDGTKEAADRLAAELPSVMVLHEKGRNGFGSAVLIGCRAARMQYVLVMPIDIPYPLQCLAPALVLADGIDCVLSYRESDDRSRLRRMQSWAFNLLVKRTLGLPMRSVNSALKLYRRELLQQLPLAERGWLIDAEILHWIGRRGWRYVEIPIPLIDRSAGMSKITLTDPLRMLGGLFVLRRSLRARERLGGGKGEESGMDSPRRR